MCRQYSTAGLSCCAESLSSYWLYGQVSLTTGSHTEAGLLPPPPQTPCRLVWRVGLELVWRVTMPHFGTASSTPPSLDARGGRSRAPSCPELPRARVMTTRVIHAWHICGALGRSKHSQKHNTNLKGKVGVTSHRRCGKAGRGLPKGPLRVHSEGKI